MQTGGLCQLRALSFARGVRQPEELQRPSSDLGYFVCYDSR